MRGESNDSGHASQCCYTVSGNTGKLITAGSGQGSADKGPAGFGGIYGEHRKTDMNPADWAKSLDGGGWGCFSEAYLNVRPNLHEDCDETDTPHKRRSSK